MFRVYKRDSESCQILISAVGASVVDTARKRGEDVFETLQGHIGFPVPVGV